MGLYCDQIKRIKHKLEAAKEKDKHHKVFGASSHKYLLGNPISENSIDKFESNYGVSLPESYKAFLLEVGNGGSSYGGSAAGPFYGIYPLGSHVNEIIESPEKYLRGVAQIKPEMSDEEWAELTKKTDDDDISDEDYDKEMGKIYAGVLPIGSQGCTYLHGIMVTGENVGRVVNLDLEMYKPKFTYEDNFLDWYERWLDEVISGDLMQDGPSWFGYTMGGNDEQLLSSYDKAKSIDERLDILNGLNKLSEATKQSVEKLEGICHDENVELRHSALQLLAKFSYENAVDLLQKSINGNDRDCLVACQSIFWYAKSKSRDWVSILRNRLPKVVEEKTFTFITYLLKEANVDYGNDILPFCSNEDEGIRVTSYYSLGGLKNKRDYLEQFFIGLKDSSPRVVHTTLQAIEGVKDRRLIEYYKEIEFKYKSDEHYIRTNLKHRLKDLGFSSIGQFLKRENGTTGTENNLGRIIKGLFGKKDRE